MGVISIRRFAIRKELERLFDSQVARLQQARDKAVHEAIPLLLNQREAVIKTAESRCFLPSETPFIPVIYKKDKRPWVHFRNKDTSFGMAIKAQDVFHPSESAYYIFGVGMEPVGVGAQTRLLTLSEVRNYLLHNHPAAFARWHGVVAEGTEMYGGWNGVNEKALGTAMIKYEEKSEELQCGIYRPNQDPFYPSAYCRK